MHIYNRLIRLIVSRRFGFALASLLVRRGASCPKSGYCFASMHEIDAADYLRPGGFAIRTPGGAVERHR
jgi:hypothetical protein